MSLSQISFGISMHFVANDLNREVCQSLSKAGVQALELDASCLRPEDNLNGFSMMLRLLKLFPVSVHAQFGKEFDLSQLDEKGCREAIKKTLDAVKIAEGMDAPVIVVHPSAPPMLPSERSRRKERCLISLAMIGQTIASTGRRIALEYLPGTHLGNDIDELDWFIDRLGEDNFGICLDVNHLGERYPELPDMVRSIGSRLIEVHISDYDGVEEKHWKPGKGILDWPGFMQALNEINFAGLFILECEGDGDSLDAKLSDLGETFRWLVSLAQ